MTTGDARINVILGLRDRLSNELRGPTSALNNFRSNIGGITAGVSIATGAVTAFGAATVLHFAQAGDEIQKMAIRTGFTTEAISELRHAAELAGTTINGMETGFRRMAQSLVDADRGLAEAVRGFDDLSLNATELLKLSIDEQFFTIAAALAEVENETLKVALAQDIFGRSGTQMLPMLEQGAEGLAAMRQEARDLGIVFNQDAADDAAQFQDAITRLQSTLSGMAIAVGGTIAPAITDFINQAVGADQRREIVKTTIAWGLYLDTISGRNLPQTSLELAQQLLSEPPVLPPPTLLDPALVREQEQAIKEYQSALQQAGITQQTEFSGIAENLAHITRTIGRFFQELDPLDETVTGFPMMAQGLFRIRAAAITATPAITNLGESWKEYMESLDEGVSGPLEEATAGMPLLAEEMLEVTARQHDLTREWQAGTEQVNLFDQRAASLGHVIAVLAAGLDDGTLSAHEFQLQVAALTKANEALTNSLQDVERARERAFQEQVNRTRSSNFAGFVPPPPLPPGFSSPGIGTFIPGVSAAPGTQDPLTGRPLKISMNGRQMDAQIGLQVEDNK